LSYASWSLKLGVLTPKVHSFPFFGFFIFFTHFVLFFNNVLSF
jgi:hypothetical protein